MNRSVMVPIATAAMLSLVSATTPGWAFRGGGGFGGGMGFAGGFHGMMGGGFHGGMMGGGFHGAMMGGGFHGGMVRWTPTVRQPEPSSKV